MAATDHGRIDPAVITALFERHGEELRLFLTGLLRNRDLAAEALQSAFAKAVESGHNARPDSLKSWLFQVAFHEAMAVRRRGKVHEQSLREIARIGRDASDSPNDVFARSEMIERVRRALDELPVEQRQVVRMRIYEEKTFAAIAAELSAPIGTVLTRMRLALKRLARNLASEE